MPIEFEMRGLSQLTARLTAMPNTVRGALKPFMVKATESLRQRVKQNIAERFKSTGRLYNSVKSEVTDSGTDVTGRVYTEGVDYAAAQEYGVTIHHPGSDKLQVFMAGRGEFVPSGGRGPLVFTHKTKPHPITIPERSYARLALVQERSNFQDGIRAMVSAAVSDGYAMAAE